MISGVDHHSLTWQSLNNHIDERIAELQLELEAPNGRDYTNMLRGSIKELRVLIERVEPPVEQNTEITSPLY